MNGYTEIIANLKFTELANLACVHTDFQKYSVNPAHIFFQICANDFRGNLMAKPLRDVRKQEISALLMRTLKTGCLLAALLALVIACAGVVQASDDAGVYHVATTYTESADATSPWQVAEMVCCHCYSTKSDGARFYHGVLQVGYCRSQRGYCEGFAKCFP